MAPDTSTGDSSSNTSPPLFLLLICVALGGIGCLAVRAQRLAETLPVITYSSAPAGSVPLASGSSGRIKPRSFGAMYRVESLDVRVHSERRWHGPFAG
jgi:hypothetical protein